MGDNLRLNIILAIYSVAILLQYIPKYGKAITMCNVHENKTINDYLNLDINRAGYAYVICENLNQNNISSGLSFQSKNGMLIQYLMFKNNSAHHIPTGTFSEFHNLEVLYLGYSSISVLHPGSLLGLFNLKELYLNHNNITEIPNNLFKMMSDLLILDLSYNKIATIQDQAFKELWKLRELHLSNNKIGEVAPAVFHPVRSLKYLDMSSNNLIYFEQILAETVYLLTLKLSNNSLERVSINFTTYELLTHVDFSHNYLRQFDGSVFPESLQSIDISFNHIYNLDNISKLVELRYFNVSNNNLTSLSSNLIKNLSKLETFQIKNNHLRELPVGFFSGCNSIVVLSLSHNELQFIEYGLLSGLVELVDLDLSYNKIEIIEADTFYGLSNLESLDVSFNKIRSLSLYELQHNCKMIKTLNLNGNNFTCSALSRIIRDATSGYFRKRSVNILLGTFDNVTNILGIPCRNVNSNNRNISNRTISLVRNSQNTSLNEKLDMLFKNRSKDIAIYHVLEKRILLRFDHLISVMSTIQHFVTALLIILILFVIISVLKSLLHFNHYKKTNLKEPEFLL